MIGLLLRVERFTTRLAHDAASLLLAVAACLAFYQVLTRFLLGLPSTWSEVAARSLMIWAVYLGISATFRQGAMIAVDLVFRYVSGRMALVIYGLVTAACLIFLSVLGWHGWSMAERVKNQNLAGMEISIAWFYAALPVGATFAILALVARFLEILRDGPPERIDEVTEEAGGVA